MELEESINFLFLIIFFLWFIKADFFFILFGVSVYLFILFYLYTSNPMESFELILNDIFVNPSVLLLPFIPLAIYISVMVIRKRIGNSKNKKLMNPKYT